jgi:dipeptidyl aminopeptidase/acylaminoacyl peptidase
MRSIVAVLALFTAVAAGAQQAAQPDIWLVPLNTGPSLGRPVNITKRSGYDNQPSFTPDSRSIFYTSTRDDAQSDIYRYDIASAATTRVTKTPESEYSATVMPDGRRFSGIRVEKDSTQRLWSFAPDGSDAKLVVPSLKPVGYHAWLDANTLVMFVLGRPNALVLGDLRSGKMDTLARSIGRSLSRLPNGDGFAFAQIADSATMLKGMDPARLRTWDIAPLPRGTQDIAWLSDGSMIAGAGSRLIIWRKGATAWADVADLSGEGVTEITRLAVSPDGKWLALVGVPR